MAAQRVDDAAEQFRTDRHFEDATRGLARGAFGDALVLAQHHGADRVLLEVQRQAEQAARELDHFTVANVGEAVNAHDAVGDTDHRTDVVGLGGRIELRNPGLDEIADLGSLDGHAAFLT